MVSKTLVRVVSCLVVLCCCVPVEGRWHDLRNLRGHRTAEQDDSPARLFDQVSSSSRHRRHRPTTNLVENDDDYDESMEDSGEEIDSPRSPTAGIEFAGDADYEELPRVPRRRLVHPKKLHHSHHRHHHSHGQHRKRRPPPPTLVDLNEAMMTDDDLEYDEGADLSRDKRHQRRKNWTEEDWKAFESSRRPELYDHDIHVFELEVRAAQNSSLCNYTVIPIPDPGGRVPRVLEHVKCNYVGNRCRERGSYCCVQTYRNVEVQYHGWRNDTIKVYSGCVCALQIYGTLKPYNPKLPLDD